MSFLPFQVICVERGCDTVFPHKAPPKSREEAEKEAAEDWYYMGPIQSFKLYACPPCWLKRHPGLSYHPVTVLAVAFALIRTEGWLSRSEADQYGAISTGDKVIAAFMGQDAMPAVQARDIAQANDAVAWFLERRQDNSQTNYERQVSQEIWLSLREGGVWVDGRPSADGKQVLYNMAKIAAGAVAYRDGVKKAHRKKTWLGLAASKRVGKPGEVLTDLLVTVTHARSKTVDYKDRHGQSHVKVLNTYKLSDHLGNAYKWFETTTKLVEGQAVLITRGRIVRHETYSGVEFTVLTRCKTQPALTDAELYKALQKLKPINEGK